MTRTPERRMRWNLLFYVLVLIWLVSQFRPIERFQPFQDGWRQDSFTGRLVRWVE